MHLTGIAALVSIVKDEEFGWKAGLFTGKLLEFRVSHC